MNFGEKVAEQRKNLGLTQDALASKCSVTRQAVAKWEKGESMPDIYTIAKLARLFSVSIEYLIYSDGAVIENQNFYIRRLEETDKDNLCSLMYEHGLLGRLYKKLNDYSNELNHYTNNLDINPSSLLGDKSIIEEYYSATEHIFLLFRRCDGNAVGIFDLRELANKKGEISVFIRNGFQMDASIFIDFFSWLRSEYQVKAITVLVWNGQEESLLSSLGFNPADGICAVSLPLI